MKDTLNKLILESLSSNDKMSAIKSLMALINTHGFENDKIYLKELIKVGTCDKGDVFCTSIGKGSGQEFDGLVLNILFNKHKDDLYGHSYDFSYVILSDENIDDEEFGEGDKELNMTIDFESLNVILDTLKNDSDWLSYQKELQKENRRIFYLLTTKEYHDNTSFEDRIKHLRKRGELDLLLNRHDISYDIKHADEMEKMGEEKWIEKTKRENDIANDILDEILAKRNKKK